MIKLDHLTITVRDFRVSRDWYARHLGLKVEFEIAERRTAALQDDAGLTLFVTESADARAPSCILYFHVDDVEAKHRDLEAAGVPFVHAPQRLFWGYGAELRDPDGYLIGLWDERS